MNTMLLDLWRDREPSADEEADEPVIVSPDTGTTSGPSLGPPDAEELGESRRIGLFI